MARCAKRIGIGVRTGFALCAECVGIMCGRHSYHARTRFASCADTLRIVCGCTRHALPMCWAPLAGRYGTPDGGCRAIVPFR
ncbi:MAG: hypothetical protein K2G76_09150 [Prevotella sp.]|nr:hypothetical protein [Prevotella sp.]